MTEAKKPTRDQVASEYSTRHGRHYKRLRDESGLSERALAEAIWPDDDGGRMKLRNFPNGRTASPEIVAALADYFDVDPGLFTSSLEAGS